MKQFNNPVFKAVDKSSQSAASSQYRTEYIPTYSNNYVPSNIYQPPVQNYDKIFTSETDMSSRINDSLFNTPFDNQRFHRTSNQFETNPNISAFRKKQESIQYPLGGENSKLSLTYVLDMDKKDIMRYGDDESMSDQSILGMFNTLQKSNHQNVNVERMQVGMQQLDSLFNKIGDISDASIHNDTKKASLTQNEFNKHMTFTIAEDDLRAELRDQVYDLPVQPQTSNTNQRKDLYTTPSINNPPYTQQNYNSTYYQPNQPMAPVANNLPSYNKIHEPNNYYVTKPPISDAQKNQIRYYSYTDQGQKQLTPSSQPQSVSNFSYNTNIHIPTIQEVEQSLEQTQRQQQSEPQYNGSEHHYSKVSSSQKTNSNPFEILKVSTPQQQLDQRSLRHSSFQDNHLATKTQNIDPFHSQFVQTQQYNLKDNNSLSISSLQHVGRESNPSKNNSQLKISSNSDPISRPPTSPVVSPRQNLIPPSNYYNTKQKPVTQPQPQTYPIFPSAVPEINRQALGQAFNAEIAIKTPQKTSNITPSKQNTDTVKPYQIKENVVNSPPTLFQVPKQEPQLESYLKQPSKQDLYSRTSTKSVLPQHKIFSLQQKELFDNAERQVSSNRMFQRRSSKAPKWEKPKQDQDTKENVLQQVLCINCDELIQFDEVDIHSKRCVASSKVRLNQKVEFISELISELNRKLLAVKSNLQKQLGITEFNLLSLESESKELIIEFVDMILMNDTNHSKIQEHIKKLQETHQIYQQKSDKQSFFIILLLQRAILLAEEKCLKMQYIGVQKQDVNEESQLFSELDVVERMAQQEKANLELWKQQHDMMLMVQIQDLANMKYLKSQYQAGQDNELLSQIRSDWERKTVLDNRSNAYPAQGTVSLMSDLHYQKDIDSVYNGNNVLESGNTPDEDTKRLFYNLAVQAKLQLPHNHPGKNLLIQDIYEQATKNHIPKENWERFIKNQIDSFKR